MTEPVLIAVDGGNSKTDLALLRADGTLLAAVRGPGSSPHQLGLDGSLVLIERLVDLACKDAGLRRDGGPLAEAGAWFLAGVDLRSEEEALALAVVRAGWAVRNEVANDTFAVLRAGSVSGQGVAVVVGAGMNCVGRTGDGRTARFLALGAISGDWGGGVDFGLAALGAAVRDEDGRGPATSLRLPVADHFGCATAGDVAVAVHQGRLDKDRLLELAPLVISAAADADAAATAIVERQMDEVVALVSAALRRLELATGAADVVLGGGILAAVPHRFIERASRGVRAVAPDARCTVCRARPIVGAALAALDAVGAGPDAHRQARESLGAAPFTVL
jgi:N-acetylglucosamine kinase-like BadF-type ATPase